jgi:hypothetical protein
MESVALPFRCLRSALPLFAFDDAVLTFVAL